MKKSELQDLLRTINFQYWDKLSTYINDVDFLNAWYEALKDYDYDLVKLVYARYSDTQFPPTAKYFTVSCEQEKANIAEEIRLALNNMYQWSTDEYQVAKASFSSYIDKIPWDKKVKTINAVKNDFLKATREGRLSIKDWLYERRV